MSYTSIDHHYGQPNLSGVLLGALAGEGKNVDDLSPNDLVPFENLHVRGRAATRDLARLAGLRSRTRVLDIGCGIGGPARTLAVEYGCRVTGIDLTESLVQAGRMLTERVGLTDAVSLHVGDALDLPFDEGSFDAAWMQHMAMNVQEKGRLYREARRVLRPGGRLALHEVVAGSVCPPHYPVPWARVSAFSFLVSPGALRTTLAQNGFLEVTWQDDTPACIEWARTSWNVRQTCGETLKRGALRLSKPSTRQQDTCAGNRSGFAGSSEPAVSLIRHLSFEKAASPHFAGIRLIDSERLPARREVKDSVCPALSFP